MGIEWSNDSAECAKVRNFLNQEMGCRISEDSGIGIKPISKTGSERIVRKAMLHALENNRKTVTIVHKGNIMKYTEGAVKDWCYNLVKTEFRDKIVTEDEVSAGASREDKILLTTG